MTVLLRKTVDILKTDRRLGIVFGFAVICKTLGVDGKVEDYYDLHGDHISEEVMMKAAADFAMQAERTGKAQHQGEKIAECVFSFPLTEDVAKALGITSPHFGLLLGFRPLDKKTMDDVDSGVYSGFSFGGSGVRTAVPEAT